MKDNCNIEVNDPDFWAKWAKKADIDQTKMSSKVSEYLKILLKMFLSLKI